jgi:hypothetical protein
MKEAVMTKALDSIIAVITDFLTQISPHDGVWGPSGKYRTKYERLHLTIIVSHAKILCSSAYRLWFRHPGEIIHLMDPGTYSVARPALHPESSAEKPDIDPLWTERPQIPFLGPYPCARN